MTKKYTITLTQEERTPLEATAKGRQGQRPIAAWKVTKIDTSSETRAMVRLLMRAYGGLLLSQQMPMTAELARAGTDHISLYEIERPRGSRDTFQRALERMDAVNPEITQILRGLWDSQAAAQLPTRPPEAQDYPIIP